jgi:hypothetical protein
MMMVLIAGIIGKRPDRKLCPHIVQADGKPKDRFYRYSCVGAYALFRLVRRRDRFSSVCIFGTCPTSVVSCRLIPGG